MRVRSPPPGIAPSRCLADRPSPSSCPAPPRAAGSWSAPPRWRRSYWPPAVASGPPRGAAARLRRRPVHARRRLGRPAPTASCSGRGSRPTRSHGGGMPRRAGRGRLGGRRATSTCAQVVRRGTAAAARARRTRVHVEVDGLEPGARLLLPVPRRRPREPGRPHPDGTAPAERGADAASASPSPPASTTDGYFTAYRHMADEDLDLVLHLGDYIYEYGRDPVAGRVHTTPAAGAAEPADDARATTASATRSTRPTRRCRPRTPLRRGSSPGTTTRSRTTTPARSPRTTRHRPGRVPARSGPPPTRPTTSTCRCAARAVPPGRTCALYRRAPLRRPARPARARHPPVPHRPARRDADGRSRRRDFRPGLPPAATPAARCSAPSRSGGCWTACGSRRRGGTRSATR